MLDQFSRYFLMADAAFSLYVTLCHPIPPYLSFSTRGSGPPSNTSFLVPTQPTITNGISNRSAILTKYTVIINEWTDQLTMMIELDM